MGANKEDGGRPDFRIKLLSGNNILLLEADGYESELFIPCIHGGRLEFQNIIPSRRCCRATEANFKHKRSSNHLERRTLSGLMSERTFPSMLSKARTVQIDKNCNTDTMNKTRSENACANPSVGTMTNRETAGDDNFLKEASRLPMACSTPASFLNPNAVELSRNRTVPNATAKSDVSKSSTLTCPRVVARPTYSAGEFSKGFEVGQQTFQTTARLTPQMARCAPIEASSVSQPSILSSIVTPREVMKKMSVKIPAGIKIIRLFRNPTVDTPKKVGRLVGTSAAGVRSHKSPGGEQYSLQLPHTPYTPKLKRRSPRKSTLTRHTQSSLQKCADVVGSASKWRKCITPLRTYSRNTAADVQRLASSSSDKRTLVRNKHVLPAFIVSSTQGTKGTHKVHIRRRKLIFDAKTSISPTSFKKQQLHNNNPVTKHYSAHSLLPKSRQQYERSKMTAFDMLTNSNRAQHMSNQLSQQFRKGCINKGSSTNPKFKQLYSFSPLEAGNATVGDENCTNHRRLKKLNFALTNRIQQKCV